MINLLPPWQKKKINQEKKWKIFLILIISFAVICISLAGTFYIIKNFSLNFFEKEGNLIFEKESEFSEVIEKEKKIKEFNRIIYKIDIFYEKSIRLVDVFGKIYEALPLGAYTTNFQFIKKMSISGEEINQVILGGYSPDWESLLEIEEGLKQSFSNVEFSSKTWTQLEDIDFLISFEIK